MTPDEYCQEKAAASGSSFYYSFLFLPERQRRAITALYAFCREVDDIVDETSEPGVARMKLAWWRTEIDKVFDARPNHPVARALAPAVEEFGLTRQYFLDILHGMELDLDHEGFANADELANYCYYAAAAVGLLSIEIFGYKEPTTRTYAVEMGTALQLVNIIRDVREDARRGRIYLPVDEMDAHGVRPDDLLSAPTSAALRRVLDAQAERARQHYRHALDVLPAHDRPAQRTGLIMGRIYMTLLEEIERDGFRVLEHRVALTPLRKLWIAWRCAREERRHARRRGP